jgi:signal transduction histidine kinase
MITAMGVVRRAYRLRIAAAYAGDEQHTIGNAADKLLDLELAVMLRHYQHDSEERVRSAEQRRRLEQVGAMRTLCAGLAHEVRNPVNSAKLQLELAARRLRKGDDDQHLAEPLERVGQEIDRLTVLLDEFLAFAQPRALDARPEDVTAVVRSVVEAHQALATQNRIVLTLDEPAASVVADVDATKLRQVVTNLVCNAIEAASRGGTVAIHDSEGHVRIRVTDDGPGIPTDVLPRIYEPFFSTKDGSTGMGMSIAHSLVALHDGTIDVRSSPKGTVVEVALPRQRPRA